ncbi:MAG TPA: flagellar biosynthetic protein FliQ [Euzebyales bacterium]|nr:flagellar biosynthetic protein FliQ [Euzebyales bacterium]
MSDTQILEIVGGAVLISLKLAGPVLAMTLVVGVAVSLVQTITQIQEQTLTFVPKLIGVALVLLLGGSWMLRELVTWVTELWRTIPALT